MRWTTPFWLLLAASAASAADTGPKAALEFELSYRGEHAPASSKGRPYPDAEGIPFEDTANIIPMTATLWRPEALVADFQRRMAEVPAAQRKKGIIVMLKTERCCTSAARLCSVTTAALEKRAAPLAAEFEIYGAWIKPRDNDQPAGTRKIETGADAWKNDAAGVYDFRQGPGAKLVFLDPTDGTQIDRTDANTLQLIEPNLVKNEGRTPLLDAELQRMLAALARRHPTGSI